MLAHDKDFYTSNKLNIKIINDWICLEIQRLSFRLVHMEFKNTSLD